MLRAVWHHLTGTVRGRVQLILLGTAGIILWAAGVAAGSGWMPASGILAAGILGSVLATSSLPLGQWVERASITREVSRHG